MKKLLLSSCIVFGCVTFASAQASDVDPSAVAKAKPQSAAKSTTTAQTASRTTINPQKAEMQAMSARGSRTTAVSTTASARTSVKKPIVVPAKTAADKSAATKQN